MYTQITLEAFTEADEKLWKSGIAIDHNDSSYLEKLKEALDILYDHEVRRVARMLDPVIEYSTRLG